MLTIYEKLDSPRNNQFRDLSQDRLQFSWGENCVILVESKKLNYIQFVSSWLTWKQDNWFESIFKKKLESNSLQFSSSYMLRNRDHSEVFDFSSDIQDTYSYCNKQLMEGSLVNSLNWYHTLLNFKFTQIYRGSENPMKWKPPITGYFDGYAYWRVVS